MYVCVCVCVCVCIWDFPGGSNGKESNCNAGDLGWILGLGKVYIYMCVCVCVCVYKMYAECKGVTLNKEQRIPILVC